MLKLQNIKSKKVALIGSILLFSLNAWSLPWFQRPLVQSDKSHQKPRHNYAPQKTGPDFSGLWEGECNHQPALDLIIHQDASTIILKYGYMEERYLIGHLNSESNASADESSSRTSEVIWDQEKDSLTFVNSQHFMNKEEQLSFFFSKVTMSLDSNLLIINGAYYQSNNERGDVLQESVICQYHAKTG